MQVPVLGHLNEVVPSQSVSSNAVSINALPKDILELIFRIVKSYSLSLVCKRWRSIAGEVYRLPIFHSLYIMQKRLPQRYFEPIYSISKQIQNTDSIFSIHRILRESRRELADTITPEELIAFQQSLKPQHHRRYLVWKLIRITELLLEWKSHKIPESRLEDQRPRLITRLSSLGEFDFALKIALTLNDPDWIARNLDFIIHDALRRKEFDKAAEIVAHVPPQTNILFSKVRQVTRILAAVMNNHKSDRKKPN